MDEGLKSKYDLLDKINEQIAVINNIKELDVENKFGLQDKINQLLEYKESMEKMISAITTKKKAVVFVLTDQAGFASIFGFLCRAYIFAKENGYDFFIKHNKWHYTYKDGWNDYFTTLKEFDFLTKYDSIDYYWWNYMNVIPEYNVEKYCDCMKELFKLKENLLEKSDEFIKTIGGEYISIYVRRGDKCLEDPYMDIPSLVSSFTITDTDKLFIQTDDYYVIDEIKRLLPNNEIHTMTEKMESGSHMMKIREFSPEDIKTHTENLLVSIYVFLKGKKCYSDRRSNIGRLHKLLAIDTVTLYPFYLPNTIKPQFYLDI